MRWRIPMVVVAAWAAAVVVLSCGEPDRAPSPAAGSTGDTALRTWQGFHAPETDRIPHHLATNPGTPWGDWVGSDRCQECHPKIYAQWRDSFHSRTLYDAVEETVFGDFGGGAVFDDPEFGFRVLPYTKPDPETPGRVRYYMRIVVSDPRKRLDTYGAGLPTRMEGDFEVLYSFGNRRHQPYVGRWPDGKHWVFPIFWNDVERAWQYDGFRPYVESCAGCHTGGTKHADAPFRDGQGHLPYTVPPKFNVPPDQEGWAEGAVGCEVCHGPGREHVEAVERVGIERYRELLKAGEKAPTIFSGRATLEEMTWQCDQCHDFFTESTITWHPTPTGFSRPPLKEPIRRSGRGDAQFYDDGSHKSPCSMGSVYRTSKMFASGVRCTDCHDPHGTPHWADLKLPIEDNSLCLSCHERQFPDAESQTRHSRHAAGSPGNRCVECHMPRHMIFTNGVQMMSDRIFKHDFSVPTGVRAPGGPPSSCNICHVDRDHDWTKAVLKAWREGTPAPR